MRRISLVFVCLLVIALMLVSAVPVEAGKGGKPGGGGGDDGALGTGALASRLP